MSDVLTVLGAAAFWTAASAGLYLGFYRRIWHVRLKWWAILSVPNALMLAKRLPKRCER